MKKPGTKNAPLPGDPSLLSTPTELETIANGFGKAQKYSVEDFFKLPERSRYSLSPKGEFFSYLGPYQRRLNLFIEPTSGGDQQRLTSIVDRDIAWYLWKSEATIIFAKDDGGNENFHLYAVQTQTGEIKKLTPFDGVRINLLDELEDSETEIIIAMNLNRPELFEPYRLHIDTGELVQLAVNDNLAEPIDTWFTDHEGRIRVASKLVDGTNSTLMYRDSDAGPFKEILTTDFREGVTPLFFHFEKPNLAYISTNIGRDKQVIVLMDLETGMEIDGPIFEHPEVDVSTLGFSRKRKVLTAIAYSTDKRHYCFLDDTSRERFEFLENKLPGYEIIIAASNRDEDKFMVRTYSDRSLGAYYFFDQNTKVLRKISEISPWLAEADMAPMLPVSYHSRDGLTINGYLTLPVGVPTRYLPVVVNPHGGPWVRDSWGYNPEVQLLANQGFAVFQMNYRGSTGYGRSFWESGFKKWGREMQDDITDGVDWLIAQGIADPKRVAIYGGSYGGYATLAGVAFTPDLFACAIDYVGVSNLFTFMETIPPYWKPYLEMMYEMVGNPQTDKEEMIAASPVFHIDKIKSPLFVVQGANDPRVNIDESDQIVRALRQRGVDVLYMVKYNEGHGFHNEENRFEFYKAMLGFLSKHLG